MDLVTKIPYHRATLEHNKPNRSCRNSFISIWISKIFRPFFNKIKSSFSFQNCCINMKINIKLSVRSDSQISIGKYLLSTQRYTGVHRSTEKAHHFHFQFHITRCLLVWELRGSSFSRELGDLLYRKLY